MYEHTFGSTSHNMKSHTCQNESNRMFYTHILQFLCTQNHFVAYFSY